MCFHVKDTQLYILMQFNICASGYIYDVLLNHCELPKVPPLDVHLKFFVETKLGGGGSGGWWPPKIVESPQVPFRLELGTFRDWDPVGLA